MDPREMHFGTPKVTISRDTGHVADVAVMLNPDSL